MYFWDVNFFKMGGRTSSAHLSLPSEVWWGLRTTLLSPIARICGRISAVHCLTERRRFQLLWIGCKFYFIQIQNTILQMQWWMALDRITFRVLHIYFYLRGQRLPTQRPKIKYEWFHLHFFSCWARNSRRQAKVTASCGPSCTIESNASYHPLGNSAGAFGSQ